MKAYIQSLRDDQQGTSAVEMGLICALIVLAMLGALKGVANETTNTWNTITSQSSAAIGAA